MGAVLATADAAKGMTVGTHGTTYGGNPLAMAVGNAAIDMILEPGFLEHVGKVANYLHQQLGALVAGASGRVRSVRGQGLMLGLKMKRMPNGDFIARRARNGLIVLPAGDNVVRMLPPLTLSEAEAREGMELLNMTASQTLRHRKRPHNERPAESQAPAFPGSVRSRQRHPQRHHRRCQGSARPRGAACPGACPMPTGRWTAGCWR